MSNTNTVSPDKTKKMTSNKDIVKVENESEGNLEKKNSVKVDKADVPVIPPPSSAPGNINVR